MSVQAQQLLKAVRVPVFEQLVLADGEHVMCVGHKRDLSDKLGLSVARGRLHGGESTVRKSVGRGHAKRPLTGQEPHKMYSQSQVADADLHDGVAVCKQRLVAVAKVQAPDLRRNGSLTCHHRRIDRDVRARLCSSR